MTDNIDTSYQPTTSARRLTLFSLLFILLTAAGLYAVYDQFAERSISFDARLIAPQTLVAIGALLLVYFISDGLRLHFTLRALGHCLSFPTIFRLVFINLFFSNVTPMATGGGFAQIWYLNRHGVPVGRATAATTIRTVLAVLFIFSLTPVFLLTMDAFDGQTITGDLGVALAIFILLYLGFFIVLLFRTRWLIGPLSGLLRTLNRWHIIGDTRHQLWQFKARREMLRFSRSFGDYLRGKPLFVVLSILFTALFLLSLFSFPALLIYSLDYDVDYLMSLGLLVVTTFIMYFSPTPGASGISEGVFGSFFSGILSGNHLILVIVSWRLITIYLGMIIGLFVLQRELIKTRRNPG
ncbi:lysylphosphatidylglycerol synthase transmembrane domain-containing protein [Marinobacter sp. 2_MG-2023]|uniref:lysylphosphatidylglycerol synthase transmembrane domain-containing protein n=1 Tax=Marinobacter sp. 2_MG-2023 TaxID=3062679 RepID=UPI0026E23B54|nr:lysylphosphatidylglycerol synthase transmembrane domain-containing protein [Marinobacter sp. 2_MG-2023]MDO6442769.1 lysylphosphatidylglycerol synthase transmembrane domain-containing protein [Marinobacter sp. 2_MG-2023]